ncbi:hypothetical protein [Saccharothrix algeriensis]|uniref:Uncharacterized protein YukE n=2 Tax=Saccharothrix algeriensis TaxID=173560 RepID=A0ABS2S844_9PSEU|nr:hypothetical protein [Saccharothrix algeriensis]MBM7811241.1 uncharacterized protein YukE [Saccharothrix algeriensis]
MGFLQSVITDSLLSDAGEIDGFTARYAPGLPSVEATLRVVREIDPESFRRIGRDVWGTGQSDGADELGRAIDACVKGLETAANQASAWTGEASNAYTERVNRMKQALGGMRKPAHDVGQALVDLADGFEFKASDMWNNIWSAVGFALGIIGVIAGIVVGLTGVGAVVGLVLGILGVLAGLAAWWHSQKFKADEQIAKCAGASADAVGAMESLGRIQP